MSSKANNSRALWGSSWQCEGRQSPSPPLSVPAALPRCLSCPARPCRWLLAWLHRIPPLLPVPCTLGVPHLRQHRAFLPQPIAKRGVGGATFFPRWYLVSSTKGLRVSSFCCKVWISWGAFFFPYEPGSWERPTLTHWMCLLISNYCCNQKSALTALSPQSHGACQALD